MSETLIGVLIGGGIATLPIIVNLVLSFFEKRAERINMQKTKIFDSIIVPRRNAIMEYMRFLGILLSRSNFTQGAIDEYKSSYQRVLVLVDDIIASKMESGHEIVLSAWTESIWKNDGVKLESNESQDVFNQIRSSLNSLLNEDILFMKR